MRCASKSWIAAVVAAWLALSAASGVAAQVLSEQKISNSVGGFTGGLGSMDQFGRAIASLGDFDGDGIPDVAVGQFNGGPLGRGAVQLLYLNSDGTVKENHEIAGFPSSYLGGLLSSAGSSVDNLGDLDGDGVCDLIVGAVGDDTVAVDAGAAWIVFLNRDGTYKSQVFISSGWGGFTGFLGGGNGFGRDVSFLGDVDGDGIGDAVVGAPNADGIDFADEGAVFVLFLNRDGTVRSHVKISEGLGGFTGTLDHNDGFGHGCGGIGDLDGDGVPDLAVGARGDADGGSAAGALWILFLHSNGRVKSHQKITPGTAGFHGDVEGGDAFASDLTNLGDLDGDGIVDLGVSTFTDDDAGPGRGAFWILYLRRDGTVRTSQKMSQTFGGFEGAVNDFDRFGLGIARVGDLDGDGAPELAAGAPGDDDGGNIAGAVWILFMDGRGLQASAEYRNAGTNPESYRSWGNYAGTPVHGGTLELSLDVASTGHRYGTIVGYLGAASTALADGQYLLVDTTHPAGELFHFPVRGVPVEYSLVVPESVALCGLTISTQGMHLVPTPGPTRRTAPDLAGALGGPTAAVYSNAIDFQVCR